MEIKNGSLVFMTFQRPIFKIKPFQDSDSCKVSSEDRMAAVISTHKDQYDRKTFSIIFLDNGELMCVEQNSIKFVMQSGFFLINLLKRFFNN